MDRRDLLRLGAVTTATLALGGIRRVGGRPAAAQTSAPPTVDRLVMTNVVDNVYDIFAKGGRLDTISVQRAALDPRASLLSQHGLPTTWSPFAARSSGRSSWTSRSPRAISSTTTAC